MDEVGDTPLFVQILSSVVTAFGEKMWEETPVYLDHKHLLMHEQTANKPAVIEGNDYYYYMVGNVFYSVNKYPQTQCCYLKTS